MNEQDLVDDVYVAAIVVNTVMGFVSGYYLSSLSVVIGGFLALSDEGMRQPFSLSRSAGHSNTLKSTANFTEGPINNISK